MGASLGGTEVHDLWSEAIGDSFRVFIGHCGPDPRAILFVTDANGLFGLAVDTVRLMQIPGLLPSLLVVGVGYPDAETVIDTVEIRARDLTPTPDDLFGTYALLKATTTFDRYIISSPSLWWDREVIFDVERQRADTERLQTEVFFGIGSLETDAGRRREAVNLADGHPAKPPAVHLDMVDDLRRFVGQVEARNDPSLRIERAEVDDEFHATVPGIVLNRALRSFHSNSEDGREV
jgi:predicted alpha/beta superfamily hydrolase